MPYDPQPGDIITVEDFMDCLVYYLMPPVAEYQDKITVLFTDGLRLTIRRDQLMGLNEFGQWQDYAYNLRVGYTIPAQYIGQNWTGRGPSPRSSAHTVSLSLPRLPKRHEWPPY